MAVFFEIGFNFFAKKLAPCVKSEFAVMASPQRILIFDFDGTLANSLGNIWSISNRLAVEFGRSPFSQEQINHFQDLSAGEVIKALKIPLIKLPFVIWRFKKELKKEIELVQPFADMQQVLTQLKKRGVTMGIVTSNSKSNVEKFLKKLGWDGYFDFVSSTGKLGGKAKLLKSIIKKRKFNPVHVSYVGDEARDIHAAKMINIKIVAVSWGFNSKQLLASLKPDFLIDSPKELVLLF
jgi:phosphoglycolate phosphatase